MKKILVLMIVVPFLLAGTSCKKNIKAERIGMVNFLAGTVTIIDGDKKAPAKVGDKIKMGMIIETGPASFVDIYFQENAVKILEKSRVKVSDLTVDLKDASEKTGFNVSQGKVFVKVAKKLAKNDDFTVSTPTATAGVRGTEFLVSEDKGKGLIVCVDGTVKVESEVSPDKQTVMVPEDKEVVVEKDKALSVKDISAENKKFIEDIRKDFQDMKASLRAEFEKQREEIRKAVADQKQQNREMIQEQKDLDKKNIDDQKALDKANIDAIKGSTSGTGSEAQQGVDSEKAQGGRTVEGVKQKVETYDTKIDK
jgi:hypothetical protein